MSDATRKAIHTLLSLTETPGTDPSVALRAATDIIDRHKVIDGIIEDENLLLSEFLQWQLDTALLPQGDYDFKVIILQFQGKDDDVDAEIIESGRQRSKCRGCGKSISRAFTEAEGWGPWGHQDSAIDVRHQAMPLRNKNKCGFCEFDIEQDEVGHWFHTDFPAFMTIISNAGVEHQAVPMNGSN